MENKCLIPNCKKKADKINSSLGLEVCEFHHPHAHLEGLPEDFLNQMMERYEAKNKKTDK